MPTGDLICQYCGSYHGCGCRLIVRNTYSTFGDDSEDYLERIIVLLEKLLEEQEDNV